MTSDPLTLITSLTNMKKKKVYIQTGLKEKVFNFLCVGGKVNSGVFLVI